MTEHLNCVLEDHRIDGIDDTIQTLKFYPQQGQNILASGGWDSKVRVWTIQYTLNSNNVTNSYSVGNNKTIFNTNLMAHQQFSSPILGLCWKPNSSILLASDCEGNIYNYDIQSNQNMVLGKHTSGCKELDFVQNNNMNLLVSGGWDKYLNFWDFRQQSPALSLNLDKKIYNISISGNLLVVAFEKRIIQYYNLNKLGHQFLPEAEFESHLKYQTKSLCTFPNSTGYGVGSIEGRIAIKNIDLNVPPKIEKGLMNNTNDFSFKSNRQNNNVDVYSVNAITFNKPYGTFATGGGDGYFYIWDKKNRTKLKNGYFDDKAPITALEYNALGDLLAYAAGNDWSKGLYSNNSIKPRIGIHYLPEIERKEKPEMNKGNNYYRR